MEYYEARILGCSRSDRFDLEGSVIGKSMTLADFPYAWFTDKDDPSHYYSDLVNRPDAQSRDDRMT